MTSPITVTAVVTDGLGQTASASASASIGTASTTLFLENPSAHGYPDATNTGFVPTGVSLTPYTGPMTVSVAGTIIDSKDINGQITIAANNVTIKRSRIKSTGNYGIWVNTGVTGFQVVDTEIDGQLAVNSLTGIAPSGWTATRCNIHGFSNGVHSDGNSTLQDSYIHDLCTTAQQPTGHFDGFEVGTSYTSTVLIRHNTIINNNDQTSAIITGPHGNALTVDNNLLAGGGYSMYAPFNTTDAPTPGPIVVTNNRFGPTTKWDTPAGGHGGTYTGPIPPSQYSWSVGLSLRNGTDRYVDTLSNNVQDLNNSPIPLS
jgi:hypothetical protein